MAAAKIVSMRVRPKRTADLAFGVGGVIEERYFPASGMGAVVTAFDWAGLLAALGTLELDGAGAPTGRLVYDSRKIRTTIEASGAVLFRLKADTAAATLDQAINMRQSRYLLRYQYIAQIQAAAAVAYPAKKQAVTALKLVLTNQHTAIASAYTTAGLIAAQPPALHTTHHGQAVSQTSVAPVTQGQHNIKTWDGAGGPDGTQKVTQIVEQTVTAAFTESSTTTYDGGAAPMSEVTIGDEVRHLPLENESRYIRALVDVLDQEFAETLANLASVNTGAMLANELKNLDLEIRKLQVDYANRFLVSPFAGRIAVVFKEQGEAMSPGDAALRLEGDDPILLIGRLRSTLAMLPGATAAQVTTTDLFNAAGAPVQVVLQGHVVSVRGHDAEIDQWDVVIECANSAAPRLPSNYEFDPDVTQVVLS